MKTRKATMLCLTFILVLSQLSFLSPEQKASASGQTVKDLIILQNVPEFEPNTEDIQLKALKVFEEGHFMTTSSNLEWTSTNQNVATVDDQGHVTLTGQNGRTFIYVTDGQFEDRIAIDYKVEPRSKGKGKPASSVNLIKEKGERYSIVEDSVDSLTIEEKVGQMLMPDFRTWDGEDVTEMLPEIEQLVEDYHLGGVILFRENVVTTGQTTRLVSDYQDATEKFGLLMTIDQEGGIVTRLQSGTDFPGNMALGAARSEDISYQVGQAIGEELTALGINTNFAPVVDVNNNPDNPVIGVRSFGEDPELVANMGISYIKGLQSTGVAATAKHFPGHGDTAVDSHLGLPEVPHEKERLKEVELYPFQQAMDAGLDMVMTAHVTFPKIDDTKVISKKTGEEIALPATLSHKVLTELMREEMGYDGVITTDALNMNAITDHFGPVDAVIRAVKAGSDIVLMPVGLEEVRDGLLTAISEGDISEERINASVERILTLKLNRGIIKDENPEPVEDKIDRALEVVGSEAHKQVETEAAEASITLVKNENALPLDLDSNQDIVVIGNTYISSLGDAIKTHHDNTTVIQSAGNLTDEQLEQISNADAVIAGTYTYNVSGRSPDNPQMQMINTIMEETDSPVIGVGIRNPYDISAYPEIDAFIAQYGFREASFVATANTIFGENNPTGKLPVTIPTVDDDILYEFGHGLSY
ncbi:glycoside hydrolase family 3 protein [Tenuibacillus multivorans]|uniref:beta-N-acetylhexosaminidase n=1 Tax=Tenuibacillus multivorans TaxID=237069 RepID=A0A1H0BYC1_9BACI|nr:glycoside hydrolase family 3 protein [Tenuibacillus multivorans]GEL78571.1 beta-hexosaminidase [Tenuibacillus multivorans]SDN50649.1 beta-N-acetylhexosaminidase [Tenuibacillus multivorans]